MLKYKVVKLKNKDIESRLSALLNEKAKEGLNFVETQIVTNYMWNFFRIS